MNLNCGPKLHGIIDHRAGTIEIACGSQRCGSKAGVMVLHTFDLSSGELLKTKLYKQPQKPVRRN